MSLLEVSLASLLEAANESAPIALRETRLELIRARLSDLLMHPFMGGRPSEEEFKQYVKDFDEHHLARLCWVIDVLTVNPMPFVNANSSTRDTLVRSEQDYHPVRDGIIGTVRQLRHLTPEVLLQNNIRIEEAIRTLLLRLRTPIEDEDPSESADRLDRLDYAKALSLAEEAAANAEQRLQYLRELQEKAEEMMQPRGKW